MCIYIYICVYAYIYTYNNTPNARSCTSVFISTSLLVAATHCNTLQHTATHCNTLQHTATHCNTLQHTALLLTPCRSVEDLFVTFVFLSRSHWFDPSMCTRVFVSKKLSMMQVFLIFLVLEESLNCTLET